MSTKFKSKLFYGKSGFFDSFSIGNENSTYFGLHVSGKDVKIENSQVSFDSRPSVNGTGVLLEGEIQNNTIISGVVYSAQVNVKKGENFTIYKGQPVYIKSAQGGNILIALASNSGESTSSKTLGLVVQDSLAHNASGTVITDGLLENFNTSSANAGDPVWLGLTGNLLYGLANKPHAPNHMVYLGVVTRAQNNGEIFVKVQNGYELDELHDLNTSTSQSGQFLFKNNNVWEGKSLNISSISGLQNSLDEKQITGNYYLADNPSGFITGIDTSSFYLNNNPSGFITGIDTSSFYTNDNPSGFITGIENVVYTIGDQDISGKKTFLEGLEAGTGNISTLYVKSGAVGINNESPQGALDVSGFALFSERPTINGTGVLLSGDIDISNFYTNDNPSGFITGIDTSSFYTNDNPSGFLTAASAASGYVASNITNISGATALTNLIQITQSGYNAIVNPATGTLYIIVG